MTNDPDKSHVEEAAAIRRQYEKHGVEGYYSQFGAEYRNPHEPVIREVLQEAVRRWQLDLDHVLDLACGSGEVTLALGELGSRKIDGVDIWPVLVGTPAQPPRDSLYYFRGLLLEAVRVGPWKLHLANGELYQLGDDISEAKNVAAANPAVVKRLRDFAEEMRGDLGLDGMGPGCRALGRVDHPQPIIATNGAVRRDMVGSHTEFP